MSDFFPLVRSLSFQYCGQSAGVLLPETDLEGFLLGVLLSLDLLAGWGVGGLGVSRVGGLGGSRVGGLCGSRVVGIGGSRVVGLGVSRVGGLGGSRVGGLAGLGVGGLGGSRVGGLAGLEVAAYKGYICSAHGARGGSMILTIFCNRTSYQTKVLTFNWIKSSRLSQNSSAFFSGMPGALLNILRFMSPTTNSSDVVSSLSLPLSSHLATSL